MVTYKVWTELKLIQVMWCAENKRGEVTLIECLMQEPNNILYYSHRRRWSWNLWYSPIGHTQRSNRYTRTARTVHTPSPYFVHSYFAHSQFQTFPFFNFNFLPHLLADTCQGARDPFIQKPDCVGRMQTNGFIILHIFAICSIQISFFFLQNTSFSYPLLLRPRIQNICKRMKKKKTTGKNFSPCEEVKHFPSCVSWRRIVLKPVNMMFMHIWRIKVRSRKKEAGFWHIKFHAHIFIICPSKKTNAAT